MNSLNITALFVINNWKLCKRKLQKGLSLIEAAMVMALSAVVVAGVIAYYQSASDNRKTEATIAMLTHLISVIHSTYASQGGYAGLTKGIIIATRALPASMVSDGKDIVMPGGETITIKSGGYHVRESRNNYFAIEFEVTTSMCAHLARLDLGSSLAGFYIGSVNNNGGINNGNEGGNNADNDKGKVGFIKPLSVAEAQDMCMNAPVTAGKDGYVKMFYEFH